MQVVTIDRSKDWTVSDYMLLGKTTMPCQLIDGELVKSPVPHPIHQRISRELFKILDHALKRKGEVFFAPIDLFIDRRNVYQPDLVYIAEDHKSFVTERGIEGPPDLVIEIISPSNSYTDRNQKKRGCQFFGIKEYWIVDPGNETLEVYRLDINSDVPALYLAGTGLVTSSVISELKFELGDLFRR